jgi:hypothetical protein
VTLSFRRRAKSARVERRRDGVAAGTIALYHPGSARAISIAAEGDPREVMA